MSDIRFTKPRNDNRIRHVNLIPLTPTSEVKDGPRCSSDAKANNQRSSKTPPWNLFITSKADEVNAVSKSESKTETVVKLITDDQIVAKAKKNKDRTMEALKTQKDFVKRDVDISNCAHQTKKDEVGDSNKLNNFKTKNLDDGNMFKRQEHRDDFGKHGIVAEVNISEIKGEEKRTHRKHNVESKSKDVKGERVSDKNTKSNKSSDVDSKIFNSFVSSNTKESVGSKVYSKSEDVKSVDSTQSAIRAVVAKCLDTVELKKPKPMLTEVNAKSQYHGKKELQRFSDRKLVHQERFGNSNLSNYRPVGDQNLSEISTSCKDKTSLQDKLSYRDTKESKATCGQAQNKLKFLGTKTSGLDQYTSHVQSVDHKSVPKTTDKSGSDARPSEAKISQFGQSNTIYTELEDEAILRQQKHRELNRQEEQIHSSEKTFSEKQPLAIDHLWKSHEPKHTLIAKEKTDESKKDQSYVKSCLSEEGDINRSTELTHRDKSSTSGSEPGKSTLLLSTEDCRVSSTSSSSLDFIEQPPSACTQQLSSFYKEIASSTCGVNSHSLSQDPSSTTLKSIDQPIATTSTVKNNCSSLSVISRGKEDKHNILSSLSTNVKPNTISSIHTQSCVKRSINKCDSTDSVISGTNSVWEQPIASSGKDYTKTELIETFLKSHNRAIDDKKQFAMVHVFNHSNIVSGENDSAKCQNLTKEAFLLSVHVVTEPSQLGKVSTQSESLKQHHIVTSTNANISALPEFENVIKIPSQKNKQYYVNQQSLLPLQNETKIGHQSINKECVSTPVAEQKGTLHNISNSNIVSLVDNKDSYQNKSKILSVPQKNETEDGQLNINKFPITLQKDIESGQLNNSLCSAPQMETKSEQLCKPSFSTQHNLSKCAHLNSDQSSSNSKNESKSEQLTHNRISTSPNNESIYGKLNSKQFSSAPHNDSESAQLNSSQFNATPQRERTSGKQNSNQSSSSPDYESKSSSSLHYESKFGLQNNNQSSSSPHNESKSIQLNCNQSSSPSKNESKSSKLYGNQSSSLLNDESKSRMLNSNQSFSLQQNDSKSVHPNSNQSSSSSKNESKSGQLNSNQSSSFQHNGSKSGQLNSNQSSSLQHDESKYGQLNSNQSSSTSKNESNSEQLNSKMYSKKSHNELKCGQLNSNMLSSTHLIASQTAQLNSNRFCTSPKSESKAVHHPLANQPSGHPPLANPSSGHPPLANQSSGHPPLANQSSGHPPLANQSSGHPPLANQSSGHAPLANQSSGHQPLANQSSGHPPLANLPSGNPPIANQSSGHPPLANQSSEHPPLANLPSGHPPLANQSSGHPPLANQSSGHQPLVNQSSGHPSLANQSSGHPPLANQSSGHPLLANQSSGHPPLANQSSGLPPLANQSSGHPPLANQSSTQQCANQSSKDSSSDAPISAYRSYRSTRLPGSEQFNRKQPIKRSISSGALSLRDNNASFFRRINDSYVNANDPAYDSDDNDDFGIDLDEMFKHLDTRRSRKPTRSYCRSTYSEKDIAENVPDESTTVTVTGKKKKHESGRAVRETVSCDRLKIRRCALADPLKMIISQEDRERIERDVERRRQSMVRKLSQFINIQFGLNKEEDLI